MGIPISIKRRLEKIEGRIRDAHDEFKNTRDVDALASDVMDELVQLHLILDRVQNSIWEKYNNKRQDKNKANVYYPVTACEEKFRTRLINAQLGDLEELNKGLFDFLLNTQPFVSPKNKWLKVLYEISTKRHERDPRIAHKFERGFGIGRGQNLYIKEMMINNGEVYFDGQAWNQQTGGEEPVRFDTIKEDRYLFEEFDVEARDFTLLCVREVRKLTSAAFKLIARG